MARFDNKNSPAFLYEDKNNNPRGQGTSSSNISDNRSLNCFRCVECENHIDITADVSIESLEAYCTWCKDNKVFKK